MVWRPHDLLLTLFENAKNQKVLKWVFNLNQMLMELL